MHTYSTFWLAWAAGLITFSAGWAERDASEELHPLEHLDMQAWLRLSDAEHIAIVEQYAHRRPCRAVVHI